VSARPPAPTLLLATHAVAGLARLSRRRMLEIDARYAEPESLAVAFSKALDAGAQGVLATPSPEIDAALDELKRAVPLYALLPAMSDEDPAPRESGIEEMLERAWRRASAWTRFVLGPGAAFTAGAGERRDLARRLPLLLDLDLARLAGRAVRGVVVASPVTDLALAAGNRAMFECAIRHLQRRGLHAAFETRNLGYLLERLRVWQVRPDFVVGPVNPRGVGMKPSPDELLAELARTQVPVLASEVRARGLSPLAEGAAHALRHGARGLVVDVSEVGDPASELRGLVA
jgi:hypothetical protein